MNCEQSRQLLPLWVGHDLSDATETADLRIHVAVCPSCRAQYRCLQQNLDTLQTISTSAMEFETRAHTRPSLWPRVAAALPEWRRTRDRFNGWIPAAAIALAATLMVAVSISSVQRELGATRPLTWHFAPSSPSDGRNLFETDAHFAPGVIHHESDSNPLLVPAGNKFVPEF